MTNKNLLTCDCDAIHEEVIERVEKVMPNEAGFNSLSNLYKMFADKTRLKILWALSEEEMCVCDLAVLLDMTKSAISHQLKSLRESNLVKYEKRGRNVYYSLVDCHVKDILEQGLEHALEKR
jgi:ArsR family transcriptional regulator